MHLPTLDWSGNRQQRHAQRLQPGRTYLNGASNLVEDSSGEDEMRARGWYGISSSTFMLLRFDLLALKGAYEYLIGI